MADDQSQQRGKKEERGRKRARKSQSKDPTEDGPQGGNEDEFEMTAPTESSAQTVDDDGGPAEREAKGKRKRKAKKAEDVDNPEVKEKKTKRKRSTEEDGEVKKRKKKSKKAEPEQVEEGEAEKRKQKSKKAEQAEEKNAEAEAEEEEPKRKKRRKKIAVPAEADTGRKQQGGKDGESRVAPEISRTETSRTGTARQEDTATKRSGKQGSKEEHKAGVDQNEDRPPQQQHQRARQAAPHQAPGSPHRNRREKPQPYTRQQQARRAPESEYCYICKQRGHFAKQCPAEQRAACFVCGKLDHTGRNCPSKQRDEKPAELAYEDLLVLDAESERMTQIRHQFKSSLMPKMNPFW